MPEPQIQIPRTIHLVLEHTKNYTYLGLNISATGIIHKAVNDLRDKARKAFYAIKMIIKFNIPIRIWLKKYFNHL